MDAYFESLLGANNIRKSQVFLVEDKAALPASELLEQLQHEDESSSSDHSPARRTSTISLDVRAFASRHSFNQEDHEVMDDLGTGTWLLNLSESSIGSRQCNEEITKSDTGKNKSSQR